MSSESTASAQGTIRMSPWGSDQGPARRVAYQVTKGVAVTKTTSIPRPARSRNAHFAQVFNGSRKSAPAPGETPSGRLYQGSVPGLLDNILAERHSKMQWGEESPCYERVMWEKSY